jgi:hypothetical protein
MRAKVVGEDEYDVWLFVFLFSGGEPYQGSQQQGREECETLFHNYTAIPQPEETEVLKGLLQREGGEI